MAGYATDEFQASTSQAGLITGIFIIGTLTGRLFIGRIIDTVGLRKLLYIGLIFYTLAAFLYFLKLGIIFLIINRFVHGFALGLASTATGTIVAQIIPTGRKGEGISFYSLSSTLAVALGPFLGLYMTQHTSFQMIFGFCLGIGIISLITASFLNVPILEASNHKSHKKVFQLSNFIEPKAVPIALITLIISFCYTSVISYINSYAKEINLVHIASFFFIVYSAAVLVSRPFTGRLMDMKGANYIMYPAFFILGAGMLLLSSASHSITLLLSGALVGLGFGNMQSCTQTIAIKSTPPHRMAMATSTFFIFLDAGLGFGPYLLGFIIPFTGYSTMYVIMGIMIMATPILYYFLHGKKEARERKRVLTNCSGFSGDTHLSN